MPVATSQKLEAILKVMITAIAHGHGHVCSVIPARTHSSRTLGEMRKLDATQAGVKKRVILRSAA